MRFKYAGSWYDSERAAADAWATDALPDVSVIGKDESVDAAAADIVSHYLAHPERAVEAEDGDDALSGALLAASLSRRIRAHRRASAWKEQQEELDFESAMREIDLDLRNAEGAENRDDFVAGLDDAIADLETLTKELRELRGAS